MMQIWNMRPCRLPTRADYHYLLFCQLVKGYLTLFCVILGTVGNLHGIKSIHLSNFDKNRGVVLAASIISLAFWDTILLWCAVFYYSVGAVLQPYAIEMPILILPWFQGCAQIALTASVWCVAAITLQRFWATRDPFRGSRSSRLLLNTSRADRRGSSLSVIYCYTYRRHFRMPIVLSTLAVLVNLPAFFELRSVICWSTQKNTTSSQIELWLRDSKNYIVWYRMVFRSIVATIGPNVFIFAITLWTILLIRGTNRSRRRLFQMSDIVSDRYASKETIQTVISLMLASKFLLLRMPTFVLDLLEAFGFRLGGYVYVSDLSNFLVVVNSATNCIIFLKAASWLERKIERRNTTTKKRFVCETLQGTRRVDLLRSSWSSIKAAHCDDSVGVRLFCAMLHKNPALIDMITMPQKSKDDEASEASEELPELCLNSLSSERIQRLGDHLVVFVDELLDMMERGKGEQEIATKIRHAAIAHSSRNIVFSSSVWREFKNSFLDIVSQCSFETELERRDTLTAWSSFISLVIREMKNGFWHIEDGVINPSFAFRRCSVTFSPA